MKVAVTSTGQNLSDQTSSVFGRCPYFVIVEVKDGKIESSKSIQNQAQNQRGGAGMAAAQTVGDEGVEAVITGAVGPNAFNVLDRLEIEVYLTKEGTVEENVSMFLDGNLEKASSPTGGPGRGKGRGRGQK